jgi:hypothetical protein
MTPPTTHPVSRRFRKRPIVIEAWQYDGAYHLDHAPDWIREYSYRGTHGDSRPQGIQSDLGLFGDWYLSIPTLEGIMAASKGDWIIRGVKGEVYPCKPDIFEATYESADEHGADSNEA